MLLTTRPGARMALEFLIVCSGIAGMVFAFLR